MINRYGETQLSIRQDLLGNGHCAVPEGGLNPGMQAQVERQPYCGNVPIVMVKQEARDSDLFG